MTRKEVTLAAAQSRAACPAGRRAVRRGPERQSEGARAAAPQSPSRPQLMEVEVMRRTPSRLAVEQDGMVRSENSDLVAAGPDGPLHGWSLNASARRPPRWPTGPDGDWSGGIRPIAALSVRPARSAELPGCGGRRGHDSTTGATQLLARGSGSQGHGQNPTASGRKRAMRVCRASARRRPARRRRDGPTSPDGATRSPCGRRKASPGRPSRPQGPPKAVPGAICWP